MFGHYLQAGLIWIVAALLDSILVAVADPIIALLDCSADGVPAGVRLCVYAQQLVDNFLVVVTLSLIVWLLARGWYESQVQGPYQ